MRKYWMAVASREHVLNGIKEGICQVCHGKGLPLKQMSPGDGLIYYSPHEIFMQKSPCQKFTALGKIVEGDPYLYKMSEDFIPWRRKVLFFPTKEVDIRPLVAKLSFIQDKEKWGFPFRRGCFSIPEQDFKLIATQMGSNADRFF